MNDEEEFEDLPPIEVDCLRCRDSEPTVADLFVMPAAEELASQRERELLCEQELRALPALPAPVVARCDSSGSEGESALAAGVRALAMSPAPTAAAATGAERDLSARTLLDALLPHLPSAAFLEEYLYATNHLDDGTLAALTDDMVRHVCALVASEHNVWSGPETVALGAWLSAVSVAPARGGAAGARGGAARALRSLLERAPQHAGALGAALAHAPPAALLPLVDALGGAAHSSLAADLCDAALAHHLHVQKEEISRSSCEELAELVSGRRGALRDDARYAVVQLVGRRLCARAARAADVTADAPRARERLLRALERAPAPARRRHADHLKVSVGVSKLLSLFGCQLEGDHVPGTKTTT